MWPPAMVALVLLLPAHRSAVAASCVEGPNTHGVCTCADQIFLNSDCSQGYYCNGTDRGCVLSCGPGEMILIDPRAGGSVLDHKCVSQAENQGICPGKMNTDCPCEGEGCEFGDCECAKQLWVSSDCKTAKFCNDRLPTENQEKTCGENEIIDVSLVQQTWNCIPDDGRCLERSFRIGCQREDPTPTPPPVTLCSYANNTLGTCECGKQLFINEDCTEGFFCMEGTFPEGVVADGCKKKCEKDEILIVNVAKNSWDCVPKSFRPGVLPLICPGKFNIECPGNGEIGECECDGQLWINEDCREGFYCDSKLAGGGQDIKCIDGERIEVNMVDKTWKCIVDDGQCPGAFHVGCESDPTTTTQPTVTLCSYANNTLGTCECGKQLFINEDCTEGFFCMDGTFPEGVVADGCRKKCEKDEVLIVNVAQNSWDCVPKSFRPGVLPLICPGKFNIECPGNGDIGECECEGQLWINEDCREGFYCDSKLAGGGQDIKCSEGERIEVNMVDKTWKCIMDDGQCPGAFHVGCESDPTTTTQPSVTLCSYANNTLGTCECGKQLFINEDCTEGFFCMNGTFPEGVVADGCRKKCEKDEVLIVNVAQNSWNCVPTSFRPGVLPLICPGKFNIECPGNGEIGECECEGQLWINADCREGFYCDSKLAGGGKDIKCNEGERIEVNMVDKTWKCITDDGQCPGAFHVGCDSDPTTPSSSTTSTPTPNDANNWKSSMTIALLSIAIPVITRWSSS